MSSRTEQERGKSSSIRLLHPKAHCLTASEAAEIVKQLHERIKEATADKLANGNLFFTSPSKPGYTVRSSSVSCGVVLKLTTPRYTQDFYVLSDYRLLRSVSPKLAYDVYEADERCAAWLERMKQAYPMPEVWERDPKE